MTVSRDTFDVTKNYRRVRYNEDRIIQDSELNEAQDIASDALRRFGDSVLREGAIVSGLEVVQNKHILTIASGQVYINGSVESVEGTTLTYDPGKYSAGDVDYVYVELLRYVDDLSSDESLSNAYTGDPAAERERWGCTLKSTDTGADDDIVAGTYANLPARAFWRRVVAVYQFYREMNTVEYVVDVVRSASGATDAIDTDNPGSVAVAITEVKQSSTVYEAGVDYQKTGNSVEWLSGGSKPISGTHYAVKWLVATTPSITIPVIPTIPSRSPLLLSDFSGTIPASKITLGTLTESSIGLTGSDGSATLVDSMAERLYDQYGSFSITGLQCFAAAKPLSFREVMVGSIQQPLNVVSVAPGKAYIFGYRVALDVPLQITIPAADTEDDVADEMQAFQGDSYRTSYSYPVAMTPLKEIAELGALVSAEATLTRGVTLHGSDPLPLTPVAEIISVVQGATTYEQGVAYVRYQNNVSWLGENEPTAGTTYTVTYTYSVQLTKGVDYTDGSWFGLEGKSNTGLYCYIITTVSGDGESKFDSNKVAMTPCLAGITTHLVWPRINATEGTTYNVYRAKAITTEDRTDTLTRGSGDIDVLSSNPDVVDIAQVIQGGVEYVRDAEWKINDANTNAIEWLTVNRPALGSTYEVTWFASITVPQVPDRTDFQLLANVSAAIPTLTRIQIAAEESDPSYLIHNGHMALGNENKPTVNVVAVDKKISLNPYRLNGQIDFSGIAKYQPTTLTSSLEPHSIPADYCVYNDDGYDTPTNQTPPQNSSSGPDWWSWSLFPTIRAMKGDPVGAQGQLYESLQKRRQISFAPAGYGVTLPRSGSNITYSYSTYLSRIDMICATPWGIIRVAGLPSRAPLEPQTPRLAIPLARVVVPGGGGVLEITNFPVALPVMRNEDIYRMSQTIDRLTKELDTIKTQCKAFTETSGINNFNDNFLDDECADIQSGEWNAYIDTYNRWVTTPLISSGNILTVDVSASDVSFNGSVALLPITDTEVCVGQGTSHSSQFVIPNMGTDIPLEPFISISDTVFVLGGPPVLVKCENFPSYTNVSLKIAGVIRDGITTDVNGRGELTYTLDVLDPVPTGLQSVEVCVTSDPTITCVRPIRIVSGNEIVDRNDINSIGNSIAQIWYGRNTKLGTGGVSQSFVLDSSRVVGQIGLFFLSAGKKMVVQIRETSGGLPTNRVVGEASLIPSEVTVGAETIVTLCRPAFLQGGVTYTVCVLAEGKVDNSIETSLSVAEPGHMDDNGRIIQDIPNMGALSYTTESQSWKIMDRWTLLMKVYGYRFAETGTIQFEPITPDLGNGNQFTSICLDEFSVVPLNTSLTWEYSQNSGLTWRAFASGLPQSIISTTTPVLVRARFARNTTVVSEAVTSTAPDVVLACLSPALGTRSVKLVGYLNDVSGTYLTKTINYKMAVNTASVSYKCMASDIAGGATVAWYYRSNQDATGWHEMEVGSPIQRDGGQVEYKATATLSDTNGIAFKAELATTNVRVPPRITSVSATTLYISN